MLAFAHGQLWPEMHRRMNRSVVCAQTGLAKHAKDLGLIAIARDAELALGTGGKRYSCLTDDAPALDILGTVLAAARETEFSVPQAKEQLWALGKQVLDYSARLRRYKHGGFGFVGGLSDDNAYLAKHNARATVLALSTMLSASSAPAFRRNRCTEHTRRVTSAEHSRRVTSALAMRPEELVAGSRSAELFFGCPMQTISEWCPLEEAHL